MIKEKHNLYIKIPPINRFFVDTLATFNVHGFVSPKEIKQKVALESMTDVYVSLVACTQNQQPFACSTTLHRRQ